VVNPTYARVLIDTSTGRMLLGISGAMDLMGMAMIKKIVNIKV
jgi:Flp pilus assembly protein TadB